MVTVSIIDYVDDSSKACTVSLVYTPTFITAVV